VRSGRDVAAARERTIEVPLDIVRSAAAVVALADQLAAHGNPNLRADAVVAAILAAAAAESAAILIAVNVEDQGDVRLQEAQKLARSLRRPAS
jgi:methenyltetrahydrofolate cyclohydrolase